jgi:hypothetical protein
MNKIVSEILDEMRSGGSEWSADELIVRLSKADPKPSPAEIWRICSWLCDKSDKKRKNAGNSFAEVISGYKKHPKTTYVNGVLVYECEPIPNIVTDFAVEYLRSRNPKRIMNPWTEEPVCISALMNALPSVEEGRVITRNKHYVWQAQLFKRVASGILGWEKAADWRVAEVSPHHEDKGEDPTYSLAHWHIISGRPCGKDSQDDWLFDAIICWPPLGGAIFGTELLVHSAHCNLSAGGVGLFVVAPSFFTDTREGRVFGDFNSWSGLSIDAVLSIPPEHRGDLPKVDLSLIVVKSGKQESIFVGELQSDPDRLALLLKNLEQRRGVKDFALGTLVEKESFQSYKALKATLEYQELLLRQGLPVVNLAGSLLETNAPKRNADYAFPDRSNALYLPTVGVSEVVTSAEQFRIKPQNYLQLVLNPESVNADYLAKFLNSELGLAARQCLFSGMTIPKITAASVRKGVEIPLPALAVQSQVIEADTSLRDLATDVENLRKQLWGRPAQVEKIQKSIKRVNREDSLDEWLKTLPFPLASILWNYHAASHDAKEQFELLLKFFEGVAAFQAAILISAARREAELWSEVRTYLAKYREGFEKSTFGTWTALIAFIGRCFRELWNESQKSEGDEKSGRQRCQEAFGSSSVEVIETMLSKPLLAVLGKANQFRNDYGGHYGVLGSETAANLLVQLRSYLSEVRSCFGQAWDNYQLLLPTDRSEWTGQHHEVFVYLVQGPNTPFLKEKRRLREPLKRNTLYLLDKDRDQAIELLPLLKISNAPKEAANACYFYNRKQSDGVRYVSYHFEKEADITISPEETERLFGELFGGGEEP